MAARPTLDPLREAAQRLNEAEIERNRLIRALRSKRETLTDLAEAADVSLGTAQVDATFNDRVRRLRGPQR